MTANVRRIIEMVLRVLGFNAEHPPDDPAHQATVARLQDRTDRIQVLAAQEQAGHIAVEAAIITKRRLRNRISDGLRLIARVAATAAREEPEIPVRLSLPGPHSSQQVFLTASRVVATEARAHQELLGRNGMSTGFLDQFTTLLDEFEQTIHARNSGTSAHIGASAEMAAVALEINRLVRVLDAHNRIRFQDDAEKRAAWNSARTIVRRAARPNGVDKTPAA